MLFGGCWYDGQVQSFIPETECLATEVAERIVKQSNRPSNNNSVDRSCTSHMGLGEKFAFTNVVRDIYVPGRDEMKRIAWGRTLSSEADCCANMASRLLEGEHGLWREVD